MNAFSLTRTERQAFFAGEHPRLTRPGGKPCPIAEGDEYRISPGFWIRITIVQRTNKGDHVARYQVFDERDKPRLLAVQNGRRNAGQYVSSRGQALKGDPATDPQFGAEPDAIDPATQARYSREGRERDRARRREFDSDRLAEKRGIEQRIGELLDMAKERGIDVRSEIRALERRAQAIERKIRRAA